MKIRAFSAPRLIAAAILLSAARLAAQAVPTTVNYQGRLTDNTPVQTPVNATVQMQFAIYDAPSGGTRLWQEPAVSGTGTAITVTNGVFSYVLGNAVALPSSVFTGATSARYLQVTINPAGGAETLTPRQLITASGYANLAQNANTAVTAATASAFAANGTNCAAGTYPLGVDAAGNAEGCSAVNAHTHDALDIVSGNLNPARMPAGGAWSLTSALNFDAGSFVIDPLNNRVGIGLAAPQFPLDIPAVTGQTHARFGGANPLFMISNNPVIGFNAYYNGGYLYGSTNYAGTLRFDAAAGGFNFSTAPSGTAGNPVTLTTRMALTNTGNVGIGAAAAAPGELLEVAGPDATVRVKNSNDVIGAFAGDTYSAYQLGMYNPTGTASNGIPANTKQSYFGIDPASGSVGSLSNVYGPPVFRNLLDDGAGVIAPAKGYLQPNSGGEVIRMIHGSINPSGGVFYGTGFTITHPVTGEYRILFTPYFAPDPVVIVTPRGCTDCIPYVSWTNQSATIDIFRSGTLADHEFAFVVIGPPQ